MNETGKKKSKDSRGVRIEELDISFELSIPEDSVMPEEIQLIASLLGNDIFKLLQ